MPLFARPPAKPFTTRQRSPCATFGAVPAAQLKADFEAYLHGFSPNVQDIMEKFEFRNQIPRLSKADALGTLIEKFLDPSINLSPYPVLQHRRHRPAAGPRQSWHGHHLRGVGAEVQ